MSRIPAIVETRFPVPGGSVALWPLLIVSKSSTHAEMQAGRISLMQQSELFVVLYFVRFALFWAARTWRVGDPSLAYHTVPFVREVIMNRHDPTYLALRERNAWRRYVSLDDR